MEKWDGKVTILPTVSSIPAIAANGPEVTSETDDQTITHWQQIENIPF